MDSKSVICVEVRFVGVEVTSVVRCWVDLTTIVAAMLASAAASLWLLRHVYKVLWIVTDIVVITKLYPALEFIHIHFE